MGSAIFDCRCGHDQCGHEDLDGRLRCPECAVLIGGWDDDRKARHHRRHHDARHDWNGEAGISARQTLDRQHREALQEDLVILFRETSS